MKKIVIISFIILIILITLLFIILKSKAERKTNSLEAINIEYSLVNDANPYVSEFDFGEGIIEQSNGINMPYPMNGLIGVPEGDEVHPLIVIFHGSHRIDDISSDKYFMGFEYLVKQLAAQGYIAVSFNVNAEYIFEYGEPLLFERTMEIYRQQLAKLESANNGIEQGYGIDLTNKIDFNNINLIGHSRGAQAIDFIAREELSQGNDILKSLIYVAPSVVYLVEDQYPNISNGIIISEYDTDVLGLDGQKIFDKIKAETNRTSFSSLIYLRGANHNYYNSTIVRDDAESTERIVESRLTREEQEDFLTHYVCNFLDIVLNNKTPTGTFAVDTPEPKTMYGYDIVASYSPPTSKNILTPSSEKTDIIINDYTTIDYVEQSFIPAENTAGFFTHPGFPEKLPLYDIRWTSSKGAFSINYDTDNFSEYTSLSLYVAVNSSINLNKKGDPQSFTLTLKDTSGNSQSVIIPKGTPSLLYHKGHILNNGVFDFWEGFIPLADLRIPFTYFKGINLSEITDITINFNKTESGAIMLSGIYLLK